MICLRNKKSQLKQLTSINADIAFEGGNNKIIDYFSIIA